MFFHSIYYTTVRNISESLVYNSEASEFVMTVIKGFFFDLDGTLVDTHEANFLAYQEAVKIVKGVDLDDSLRDSIKAGESSHDFLPKHVSGIEDHEVDAVNSEKKRLYPQHLSKSTLNTELVGFLKNLTTHYTTVLVTTAKRKNAQSVLDHHSLAPLFTHTIYGDDVADMKPHPEAYLLALKLSGLQAYEVLAFEDSAKGMESATAAGINVIQIKDFL